MAVMEAEPVVNLRALRNEADWLPHTFDEVVTVRRFLVEAGHPDQVVNGIVGWLVSKASGDEDLTSAPTRSKYRKVLADLNSPLRSELRSDSSVESFFLSNAA